MACRFKTNKTKLPFIILEEKFEINTLQVHERFMKRFKLEINYLRVQILAAKMT